MNPKIIKKDIDFTDRTQDEIAQIIADCISVIPQKGTGSRDHWVRVGMAIHSVLPNDMGLHLWSSWSSEDPDYAEEWENGNPCKDVFYSFKSKSSGIGLGTLIWHPIKFFCCRIAHSKNLQLFAHL